MCRPAEHAACADLLGPSEGPHCAAGLPHHAKRAGCAGLLSLDPSGDPTALLASLTMGTEVEVQFGRSLRVRSPCTVRGFRV